MFRCLLCCLLLAPAGAFAGQVGFANGWKEQSFSLFSRNSYSYGGGALGIVSDGSVSLTYRAVDRTDWDARAAAWDWAVSTSVPPTDLRRKGGDDRNIALYFVFLPRSEAERIGPGGSVRKLLTNDAARVLIYVWGGAHGRGDVLASPYLGPRGKTLVRRAAGTGAHREEVDLARDYARAFGGEPGALVGLAVSADRDDTETRVKAQLSGLVLR